MTDPFERWTEEMYGDDEDDRDVQLHIQGEFPGCWKTLFYIVPFFVGLVVIFWQAIELIRGWL